MLKTDIAAGRVRNRPIKDYAGQRFGRLVALELIRRDDSRENNHLWRFQCDCGAVTAKGIKSVRSGHTSSCGCLQREALVERNTTHGLTRKHKTTYRSWKDMRARCTNANHKDFKDYGGRGIAVCARWDEFPAFLADMGERPLGMTLDRVDVNQGYGPENCRWADAVTQANNKRSNRLIEWRGEVKTLLEWCRVLGMDQSKVGYRLRSAGMTPDDAFADKDYRIEDPSDRDGGGI
jgi:hypothetical protein